MRKTSSYARKLKRLDPLGGLRLISELQPFTKPEQASLSIPPRIAFESMRTGQADESDLDTIAAIVNVALIRCEQDYPDHIDACKEGQDAVMRIKARYMQTRSIGMTSQDMKDLLPIIDLHEQLIELSTPKEMMDAMKEVLRRIKQKHVLEQ